MSGDDVPRCPGCSSSLCEDCRGPFRPCPDGVWSYYGPEGPCALEVDHDGECET